jgi:hypothetical protein
MNKEEKPEVLGVNGLTLSPFEVAAFESEKHPFSGEHRFVFLMKSGQIVKTPFMIETCERSWRQKLQVLFDYIHPGEIERWKIKNGFTGYLDLQGVSTSKLTKAKEEVEKENKDQTKFGFLKKKDNG